MRIRNSRPSFPPPPAPEAKFRSSYAVNRVSHSGDCFSVEEESRRIGWSCCPLKKTLGKDSTNHHLLGRSSPIEAKEKEPIKCVNENESSHGLEAENCQANGWRLQGRSHNGNEFTSSFQGDGKSSDLEVMVGNAFPSSFFKPGKTAQFKRRNICYQWGAETRNARPEADDVIIIDDSEDSVVEVEEKDGAGKVEAEGALLEVTAEREIMHKQDGLFKNESCQGTPVINCVTNYASFSPCPSNDSLQIYDKDEFSCEEISVGPKEKPRRGWKRKGHDRYPKSNITIKQLKNSGWSKKGRGISVQVNCRYKLSPKKTGRLKKVDDISVQGNDRVNKGGILEEAGQGRLEISRFIHLA